MTLKTVLKNFLNYADTLDAQKKLGKDLYEIDFQKLKGLTEELKHDKDFATSEGLKEVNRRKNRYKDILPYDYTRVILSEYPGVPGSDFINANYIKGASGSLAYIASQGPLPNTVVDFWRMIWECEIQVIVMACNEQESGKYKCECYWPTDEEKKQYGNINVEFVKWRQVCPDFLVRTLKACWETEERVICQFHYTTWPDHGVPNSVQPILELVRLIRDCQASEAVPVLIHCSAGCGRTGTICAIDFVWGLMRMGRLTKNFNLYNVIADMRRQRIAMVQTKEQYVLVHKAVSSLFEQQLRVIDSHTYENLDEDGEPLIFKEMQQEEDIYEDIIDPPFEDNYEEKHDEKKNIYPPKNFIESVPKNDFLISHKKESYLDYLCHIKKSSNEIHSDIPSADAKISNEMFPDKGSENDFHYTQNSRTLQKLCREESVKRLISGWNKAVEQIEDTNKTSVDCHHKLSRKHSENLIEQQKRIGPPNAIPDAVHSRQKSEPARLSDNSSFNKNIPDEPSTSSEESTKAHYPEDAHAGKLVGKATVIRRPSIAKLKALFEKSSPEPSNSDSNNRQRRALFRSHSHYVSHSSRAFTLSDGGEPRQILANSQSQHQPNSLNSDDGNTRRDASDQREQFDKYRTISPSYYVEGSKYSDHHSEERRGSHDRTLSADSSKHDGSRNFPTHLDGEAGSTMRRLPKRPLEVRKERAPELPIKKKLPAPPPDEPNTTDIVPRFQVNLSSNTQSNAGNIFVKSTSSVQDRSVGRHYVDKSTAMCPADKLDNCNREYRRHSQEVERHVLHKNQSFSDPEQSSIRFADAPKQAVKPNSVFPEQTYPKLTYSCDKIISDNRTSYETTYMNVNSIAQKNIRQIEDKLKNHPRGAIIDLTSRKSYVEEMSVNPEKNYVFKNISQPVKFLQPQESKDLKSSEKNICPKQEIPPPTTSTPTAKLNPNQHCKQPNSTNHEPKVESSKSDLENSDSKNLLLHSPPPKSKRSHLSKTNVKSPVSPPATTISTSGAPENNSQIMTGNVRQNKQSLTKAMQPANFSLVSSPPNLNVVTSNPNPADRSDPRYFPVNRQTASDAKYECEKHKALNREQSAANRTSNIYETLYSAKHPVPIYQKLPLPYDKSRAENYEKVNSETYSKDSKYVCDVPKNPNDKESSYGLQRSTSGPQMSSDSHSSDSSKSLQSNEMYQSPSYDQSKQHSNSPTAFPQGPPKPPRTFHYDSKGVPTSESYKTSEQSCNNSGGRYIVTVASPKQSNPYQNVPPPRNGSSEFSAYNYVPQPPTDPVHMSRSYPLTNYDFSHPRPYGKHFQPESVVYRNVQPISNNGIYNTVREKVQPRYVHQDIYGTVKQHHRANYENVYDTNAQHIYKNSPRDQSIYGVLPQGRDYGDDGVPKRVYFDTLQRKQKQHVSWRSHDDMDIRPAPSARLKEQIHARRSMVELDNLEISLVTDEGYPERIQNEGTMSSPEPSSKISSMQNESHGMSAERFKDTHHHKRTASHGKEPTTSFGETLSKAFGRFTSLTKFNTKDAQSSSPSQSDNSISAPKSSSRPKDRIPVQSPTGPKQESPSEQWTQV